MTAQHRSGLAARAEQRIPLVGVDARHAETGGILRERHRVTTLRREPVNLVPLLIMQGGLDDNMLPSIQEKFAAAYKAAGGECQYELFEGCEHEWVAQPGPQTDRAREMVKRFIARQLTTKS